jgi:cation-transporting ATPase 13A1
VSIASLLDQSVGVEASGAAAASGGAALRLDPDARLFHSHVLFGGTEILQHGGGGGDAAGAAARQGSGVLSSIATPPSSSSGGCIAYVLRTGFYSKQGGLVRTMVRTADRVTVNSKEPFLLLGVLFVFALFAASYVLREGLSTPGCDRWKLAQHCIMIITQVVPPELPLELSLAVTTSLARLQRCKIFCTEPFRVPLAGKVEVCCFDKTGTITSDRIVIKGVAGLAMCGGGGEVTAGAAERSASVVAVTDKKAVPLEQLRGVAEAAGAISVLAGCHELLLLGGVVEGKPMERDSLRALGWTLRSAKLAADAAPRAAAGAGAVALRLERVFPFNSTVKCMSTIVRIEVGARAASQPPPRVVTKVSVSFMYRYIVRESCSQFDSLPLTSLNRSPASSRRALRR